MKTCDLQLAPRSPGDAERLARIIGELGIGVVGVEAGSVQAARAYVNVFKEHGIEAYTRVTIEARVWQEAYKEIGRAAQQGYELIAVKPRSAEAARLAARDPRVALVQLPPGMARYMDRSQALMLREGGAVVEVRLLPLLRPGDPRTALRGFMVISRRAAALGAPFTVSSGARSLWEVWSPASARALLEAAGVPSNVALLALTAYCRQALSKAARLGSGIAHV